VPNWYLESGSPYSVQLSNQISHHFSTPLRFADIDPCLRSSRNNQPSDLRHNYWSHHRPHPGINRLLFHLRSHYIPSPHETHIQYDRFIPSYFLLEYPPVSTDPAKNLDGHVVRITPLPPFYKDQDDGRCYVQEKCGRSSCGESEDYSDCRC